MSEGFQVSPRCIFLIVDRCTENFLATSPRGAPWLFNRFLISLTSEGVSFFLIPGSRKGVFTRLRAVPLAPGTFHVSPRSIASTVRPGTPEISAMALPLKDLSAPSDLTKFTVSSVYLTPTLAPSAGCMRPADQACCMFSSFDTHSRFSRELSVLQKFLWFTCGLSTGWGPTKASITSLCTKWVRAAGDSRGLRSPNVRYPRRSMHGFLVTPGKFLTIPETDFVALSNDLTRPKSETSYRPSYPTTGNHFSTLSFSIFNLFLGALDKSIKRISSIAQWPSLSVQRRIHQSWLRVPGAFAPKGRLGIC